MMSFPSMPNGRSFSDASSAFGSCESMHSEDSDDDDCQVVGVRPPPRTAASGNSSWSAWEVKSRGKRPGARGEVKVKGENGHVGAELVDDNQQSLRREWEAATLRRRTCPPMRSEGSKAGTNGYWGSHAPHSGSVHRETGSSANLGGESGAAETVQSNGHVSPVQDVSLHTLSESTSTSAADSVVQVPDMERRENGDAEPDEVASERPGFGSAAEDQLLPESSSSSVFRRREDPPLGMESPPRFARGLFQTEVKKGFKRRYEPEDAAVAQMKLRTNRTDGASVSGHGGINSLKHMDIGNRNGRDGDGIHWGKHMDNNGDRNSGDAAAGGLEPAFGSVVEQDLVGAKEKLKETAGFKLADEEEWARRQQELQKQAQEARRLRERKRAETDRKNEVELRQKQRLEEIRQTQQEEERNMGLKDKIRGKVQADLERMASGCRDMATLLRLLRIPVEGGVSPTVQQVNAAYKKALLRFHPDRTSALAQGDPQRQVEAEETFKLITRMKPILKPSSIYTAMTAW